MTRLPSRATDQKDGELMNQDCRSSNEVWDYWVGKMAVTISSPILASPSQLSRDTICFVGLQAWTEEKGDLMLDRTLLSKATEDKTRFSR